jgi:hypothetical protein
VKVRTDAQMPKPTVNVTSVKLETIEGEKVITARGSVYVSRGLLVQFDVILSTEEQEALSPVLSSIEGRVRKRIGQAVKKSTTNVWDNPGE